jgi:hypothetical protein
MAQTTSGQSVFVDGPFVNAPAAIQDGQTLQGVESVATGGLYVVSAALSGGLTGTVNAVAGCLANTAGQGTLPPP